MKLIHCNSDQLWLWVVVSLSVDVFQEALVDSGERVVTTPAFMCEAGLHEVFDGIGAMISQVLKLADSK